MILEKYALTSKLEEKITPAQHPNSLDTYIVSNLAVHPYDISI
jgi:hypothetical protein